MFPIILSLSVDGICFPFFSLTNTFPLPNAVGNDLLGVFKNGWNWSAADVIYVLLILWMINDRDLCIYDLSQWIGRVSSFGVNFCFTCLRIKSRKNSLFIAFSAKSVKAKTSFCCTTFFTIGCLWPRYYKFTYFTIYSSDITDSPYLFWNLL